MEEAGLEAGLLLASVSSFIFLLRNTVCGPTCSTVQYSTAQYSTVHYSVCGPTGELAAYLEAILSSSRSRDTVDMGDLASTLHV